MRSVTVASTQIACTWDKQENIDKATALVTEAAKLVPIYLATRVIRNPLFLPST